MSQRSDTVAYFAKTHTISFDEAEKYYDLGFRTYQDLWNYSKLPQKHREGIYWRVHLDQFVKPDELNAIFQSLNPLRSSGFKISLTGNIRRNESSKVIVLITDAPNGIFDMMKILPHNEDTVVIENGKVKRARFILLTEVAHYCVIYETTPITFGLALLQTTGPTEFNDMIRDRIAKSGMTPDNTSFFTEESVFNDLNIPYIIPSERSHLKRLPVSKLLDGISLGYPYSLSEIICGQVSSQQNSCNSVSAKISDSLVRVAATRIFSDPYQSIMEPIANSIDSYRRMYSMGGGSIGKFGMGFFSMFYWLVGQPIHRIIMMSRTFNDNWSAEIHELSNNLTITFKSEASVIFDLNQTGTFVLLMNLPESRTGVISNFRRHIAKFKYFNDVKIIYLELAQISMTINNLKTIISKSLAENPSDRPQVLVFIISNRYQNKEAFHIGIYDNAEGITKNILLNSLLIPSSSSKGLISMTLQNSNDSSNSYMDVVEGLALAISVDNIIVVHVQTESEDKLLYRIDLPLNTPLPVSRDDIIVSGRTYDFMLKEFLQLTFSCIHGGYNLEDLFKLFRLYAQYSGQPQVYDLIQKTKQFVLELPDLILVPSIRIAKILHSIGQLSAYMVDANIVKCKQQLDELFIRIGGSSTSTDVFKNIRLVHLPGTFSTTDAGISGYLFIDSTSNNIDDIIDSYPQAILRRVTDIDSNINPDDLFGHMREYSEWKDAYIHNSDDTNPNPMFIDFDKKYFSAPYRDRDMGLSLTFGRYKLNIPGINISTPIQRPEINIIKFIELFDLSEYNGLFNLLYSTIEAWLSNMGRSVYFDMDYIGYLTRPRDTVLHNFFPLPKTPTFKDFVKTIFMTCYINVYIVSTMATVERVKEYIMAINQFFTRAKLNIPQGTSKMIFLMRNTIDGWYNIDDYGKNFINLDNLTLSARNRLVDGFFISLDNNLKDGELDSRIYLNDPRHFPHLALLEIIWTVRWWWLELENMLADPTKYELLYGIIERTASGFEAVIICKVITLAIRNNQSIITDLFNNFSVLLNQLIAESRKRFPATFFVQYLKDPPNHNNENWITTNVYTPLVQAMEIHLNYITSQKVCVTTPTSQGQIFGQFNLKNLIEYVYDHEVNLQTLDDITILSQNMQNYVPSGKVNLQIIEIAINEGTSKPFVQSVLTELVQNSVDAINHAIANDRAISENIEIDYCTQRDTFQLKVRDFVGIPIFALLSLLIPFYSSKSAGDMISTGEMGTGFFNSYRQPWCREVVIRSGQFQIIAVPQIYQDRVVDIVYTFMRMDLINYTDIIINSYEISGELLVETSLDTHIFSNNYLGLIAKPVIFNNRLLQQQLKTIYKSDTGTVKLIIDGNYESMLLTNGVPFGPLIPFIEAITNLPMNNALLMQNVVVDINKQYYLPVQSRNRVNLEGSKLNRIVDFLSSGLAWVFFHKLLSVSDSEFEKYLPGGSSSISIDQLSSHLIGLQILHRYPNNMGPMYVKLHENLDYFIGDMFQSIMTVYKNEKMDPSEENTRTIILRILQSQDAKDIYPGSPVEKLFNRWFRWKRAASSHEVVINSNIKIKMISVINSSSTITVDQNEQLGLCLGIFQTFTNVFYEIGRQLKLTGARFGATPAINVGDSGSDNYAVYMVETHQIVFNQTILSKNMQNILKDWPAYINLLRQNERIKARMFMANSSLRNYIGNTLAPAATLTHELFHSITGTSHGSGAHDNRTLIINDEEFPNMPYDECVAKIYTAILGHGFVDMLLTQV